MTFKSILHLKAKNYKNASMQLGAPKLA